MDVSLLKAILAITASFSTILQFFSGSVTARKIISNKSIGDLSIFPFLSGWLSTSLWLKYGTLINDYSLIFVNCIGVFLFFLYVMVFMVYSHPKANAGRRIVVTILLLVVILYRTGQLREPEEKRAVLGTVSSGMTILFFASHFTSLFHVIKEKSTECLPFYLIISAFFVSLQWLMYGVLLNDAFIQIPNFIGSLLSGLQLSLFLIYPPKETRQCSANVI